jgi:phenylacetate-CoA ligase
MSGGQTEKQVQLITDFEPRVIMVTPSYCLNIIDEMERQGLDPAASSLEIGIFGAEPWTDELRAEIEQRLGIDAVDIYGLSEVIGPGVSQECVETKDGLTVWEDHFYPEIIDPESGKVLPDGARGELVLTSLTKQAMPIIRYRTRDLTRLLPGTARVMRRMERVTGRSDDMLIIRGVNVFPSQVEAQILSVDGLSPHYVLQVDRVDNLLGLTIRVERAEDAAAADTGHLAEALRAKVKDHIGVSAEIDVCPVGALPRSLGKAQRVVGNDAQS